MDFGPCSLVRMSLYEDDLDMGLKTAGIGEPAGLNSKETFGESLSVACGVKGRFAPDNSLLRLWEGRMTPI